MRFEPVVDILTIYREILSGRRNRFPQGTWDPSKFDGMQNFSKCFRYVIFEILKWNREDILDHIDSKIFFKHFRLTSGLTMLFDGSPYAAMRYSFPEWDIHFWEMKKCPSNKWDMQSIRCAIRWLVIKKLKMTRQEFFGVTNYKTFFEKNGLKHMPRRAFNIMTMEAKRDVTYEDIFKYALPEFMESNEHMQLSMDESFKNII